MLDWIHLDDGIEDHAAAAVTIGAFFAIGLGASVCLALGALAALRDLAAVIQ